MSPPWLVQVAAVHPGFGTAGSFNVSVQYKGPMKGGRPLVAGSAYRSDRNGRPYMYQTFAEVLSVSPASGSLAGGTVVTITGRGFPTLDLGLGDTLAVMLSGVPCAVLSSSYGTITCRSGPAPAPPAYAAAAPAGGLGGLYPGMRGAEYEFYKNTTLSPYGSSGFWQLNSTITVANKPGSYKAAIMDAMESRPSE